MKIIFRFRGDELLISMRGRVHHNVTPASFNRMRKLCEDSYMTWTAFGLIYEL